MNLVNMVVIIVVIFSLFFGILFGVWLAKRMMDKKNKKIEQFAKEFLDGKESENAIEISGVKYDATKFILRDENNETITIDLKKGGVGKKMIKEVIEEKNKEIKEDIEEANKKIKKIKDKVKDKKIKKGKK